MRFQRTTPRIVLLLLTGFIIGRATVPLSTRAVPTQPLTNEAFPYASDLLAKLDSPDERSRVAGMADFQREHEYLVNQLVVRVDQRTDDFKAHTTAHLAARLLGKIGGQKAIPVLLHAIDYKQPEIVTRLSSLNGYPCAKALMEIGETAIPSMLSYLRAPMRPSYRGKEIEGTEPAGPVSDNAVTLCGCIIMSWTLSGWDEQGAKDWLQLVRGFCQRSPDSENLRRLDRELARMATEGVGFPRK